MESSSGFDPHPGPGGAGDPVDEDGWGAPDEWLVPTVPDVVDLVVETQVMISVFAAQQLQRVDAMRRDALRDAERHGYQLTAVIDRSTRLELACALGITEAAAGELLGLAEQLVHSYPSILDALGGGRITQRHASLLADAIDQVEPDLRAKLLPRGLTMAEALPVGKFRVQLRRLVDAARAVTLTQRHEEAAQTRRVALEPTADAMAWLHLYLPTVETHAIHGRATAIAKSIIAGNPDETRTLDQLRADVLADLLIDGDTTTLPPEARGIRPTAVVTVPALALLGVDGDGDRYASVEGVGPIPLERARELCGTADGWMRILTHPETGMVLSVGRDRYSPPPSLRRLVAWRAETCMAPGCNVPASRCQIDHNTAWEHGGHTCLQNLCPFCQGHHTVKHHGRWIVEQIPDSGGAILWTSPTGRHYRIEPERRVPVFTPTDQGTPPF